MEIVDQKKLHHHALPLALLSLAFILLSAACFGFYRNAGLNTEVSIGRDLLTQVVHVRPTANGTADVSLGEAQPAPVGPAAQAGQASSLSFSFSK